MKGMDIIFDEGLMLSGQITPINSVHKTKRIGNTVCERNGRLC